VLLESEQDQNQIKDVGTITPYSNLTATYSVSWWYLRSNRWTSKM